MGDRHVGRDTGHDQRAAAEVAQQRVEAGAGKDYGELRGVELSGTVEFVGEVPRTGEPDPGLVDVERLFARKNFCLDEMPPDGRHAWVRLTPESIASWDFRKLASS